MPAHELSLTLSFLPVPGTYAANKYNWNRNMVPIGSCYNFRASFSRQSYVSQGAVKVIRHFGPVNTMTELPPENVILFDGECNFCTSSVQFVIRHDKRAAFRFVPIQSERGRMICRACGLDPDDIQTFLVLRNGRAYVRSDAAFEVVKQLGYLWRLLVIFKAVPAVWRDWIYTWIAKNRYRWFGRRDTCKLPSDDIN